MQKSNGETSRLRPGDLVGTLELLAPIGQGGMGVVWKARDPQLNRTVAIKFLPESFANDADRVMRFEREARALAALNHPNIATIYSIEKQDSLLGYTMEYVSGNDLTHYVGNNGSSLEQAIEWMKQVAAALEAAHERGIVHRDMKPSNIRVSDNRQIKVIDFGLAKTTETTPANSEDSTQTQLETQAGSVLGTVPYMSPEQLRGEPVDKRSDIWSFGCVFYELLSGTRPFAGTSTGETIAAIMTQDPDYSRISAPANVIALIKRCLVRDATWRLRDIGEARIALNETFSDSINPPQVPKRHWHWMVFILVAFAFALGWVLSPLSVEQIETSRVLDITLSSELTLSFDSRPGLALSPDGKTLVYAAIDNNESCLFYHSQETGDTHRINDSVGASGPFFGPSSDKVYFVLDSGVLKSSDLESDSTATMGLLSPATRGACATKEGVIFAMSKASGLSMLSPGERFSTPLVELDDSAGEVGFSWPSLITSNQVLITARQRDIESFDQAQLVVVDLKTKSRRTILNNGYQGRYIPSGFLLFVRNDKLLAVPYNPDQFELTGEEKVIVTDLACDAQTGAAQYAVSDGSTLAYVAGNPQTTCSMVEIDRTGKTQQIFGSRQTVAWPRVSPDDLKIAYTAFKTDDDIWIHDLQRASSRRLTFGGRNVNPCWYQGGDVLAYSSVISIPKLMTTHIGHHQVNTIPGFQGPAFPACVLGDGTLIAHAWSSDTLTDIYSVSPGDHQVTAIVQNRFDETNARVSPNEKWLAFSSTLSGQREVYVQAFPSGERSAQVSEAGGDNPVWSRDGQELFYLNGDRWLAVKVSQNGSLGRPSLLFKQAIQRSILNLTNYDVTQNGTFIAVQRKTDGLPQNIQVVIGLEQRLKRLWNADDL